MPQQYLDATVFNDYAREDPAYSTNFGPVLASWMPPKCPNTFDGKTQVYDVNGKTCTPLPRDAFMSDVLARSSGACASQGPSQGVFLKSIDGKCYDTNECPVAASYDQACVNAQNIPVRQVPFSGPGAIINNAYAGNAADWWRYT